MKIPVILVHLLLPVLLLSGCASAKNTAQREEKALRIREKAETFQWTFQPRTALPVSMRPVNLTPEFSLKVSGDTVTSYLPYFGRAYVAPFDPHEGGFQFTAPCLKRTVKSGNKPGLWILTFEAYHELRTIRFVLNLWENGQADLMVVDPNRQTIHFDGEILDDFR